MFKATTHGITVNVLPVFIDERSDPQSSQYFWAYRISIENQSGQTVQLLSRYWQITDGIGRVEEVQGDGVVGEQPVLADGETYTYTSGCPLQTPSGIMVGKYKMVDSAGKTFEIDVPAFPLDLPDHTPSIN
ncbi:MAG: Co2+/Mg2+ efflux protein ApaG [Rhizobiaceae bacterium]|nr:Co2+/Mg2+ efflux protein ApaG [Rhizobiaceae bacterium]